MGSSKTLRASPSDWVAIIAAGVTLHETLAAHDSLSRSGVHRARVIPTRSSPSRKTPIRNLGRGPAIDGGLGDPVAAAVGSMVAVTFHNHRVEGQSFTIDSGLEMNWDQSA